MPLPMRRLSANRSRGAEAGLAGRTANPGLPRIRGYRIGRKIGDGRRSAVHVAQELVHGDLVALKLIPAEILAADNGASFTQEFAIPALVQHRNVIRVLDHGLSEGFAYIAMEHAGGGHLGERIRRGLKPAEAVSLLRQAALALRQLHRQGLVHRDVKPANLLLRHSGELVLADFGLARRRGETDSQAAARGTMVGTPRYAAPEQAQGGAAQASADVYSLGVVLHEMLCGKPPFPGETLTEVLCQNLIADVPRLPRELAALQPLVDAMLEKNMLARLADGDAVLEQLAAMEVAGSLYPVATGTTVMRCLT
jgi:serine/threonine protein kinase